MDEPNTDDHEKDSEPRNHAPDNTSPLEGVIHNVNATPHAEPAKTPQEKSKSEKEPSYWPKIAEAVIAWLRTYWEKPREKSKRTDVTTVILTALIAVASFWSAWIFQGQLNTSREELVSVQRAFVVPHDVAQARHIIHDQRGEHAVWTFTTPWENTGTTPATITSQAFFEDSLPDEPTENQFARGVLLQNALLAPKAVRNVGNVYATDTQLFGRNLPDLDKEIATMPFRTNFTFGPPFHFFWGWVTYMDIFPKTPVHVTEFCEYLSAILIIADSDGSRSGFRADSDHHSELIPITVPG